MKKMQIKKLVMAGLVAGTVVASQGVVNATEGECVIAAGAGCGGSCGGQRRNLTADNAAPHQQQQARPGYERAATQEEIEQYKKNNPDHVEVQKGCAANGGCHGKAQPAQNGSCAHQKAPR